MLTFIVIARSDTEAILVWHMRGDTPTNLVQLPFTIPGGGQPREIPVPVRQFPQWRSADSVGLALKAGSEITLQEIRLEYWNLLEKIREAWKTFWTFDTVTAYTINFLWGPLLTFTPFEREMLFLNSPPMAWSANRIYYGILLVTGVLCFVYWFIRLFVYSNRRNESTNKRINGWKPLQIFFFVFAAVWLIMDLRMGLEFLSYVATDYKTYISKASGERTFRHYLNFHDVTERSLPELQKAPRFVFVGPIENLLSYVRYRTYPSIPVFPDQDPAGVKVWLIFKRPDFSVNGSGTLLHGTNVIAKGGSIVERFDSESFLYVIP